MCTAITYQTKDFYFGRTLDYDCSYGEEIVITPHNFTFIFRNRTVLKKNYAIIGMAHVAEGCPLYYDAINERGLGMAGLNFTGNADYKEAVYGKDNIASFEFIPWVLRQCATVKEAKELISRINITNTAFSDNLPVATLHWIVAGRDGVITVESVKEGINVYDNPVGVLTNNPPFMQQMFQLNNYMNLSAHDPQDNFAKGLPLHIYSRGMGAIGLPGDLSSQSRFARAVFTKLNSVSGSSEPKSVSQFFHILGSVCQQRGCCITGDGKYETTIYTSCCNTDKGIYYYNTYDNHQIAAINMHNENLDGDLLIKYPLIQEEQFKMQN